MKKYYKTKNEANKARVISDPHGVKGLHVFKMPRGTRKAGWFAVCTEIDYLNTY